MSPDGAAAAADLDEDERVADDDDDARDQDAHREQHLLGRLAVLLQDRAGEGALVQA